MVDYAPTPGGSSDLSLHAVDEAVGDEPTINALRRLDKGKEVMSTRFQRIKDIAAATVALGLGLLGALGIGEATGVTHFGIGESLDFAPPATAMAEATAAEPAVKVTVSAESQPAVQPTVAE